MQELVSSILSINSMFLFNWWIIYESGLIYESCFPSPLLNISVALLHTIIIIIIIISIILQVLISFFSLNCNTL